MITVVMAYLFELALVILVGDHESQSQVTFHTSSSFTQQRMLRFAYCGLHACRHTEEGLEQDVRGRPGQVQWTQRREGESSGEERKKQNTFSNIKFNDFSRTFKAQRPFFRHGSRLTAVTALRIFKETLHMQNAVTSVKFQGPVVTMEKRNINSECI